MWGVRSQESRVLLRGRWSVGDAFYHFTFVDPGMLGSSSRISQHIRCFFIFTLLFQNFQSLHKWRIDVIHQSTECAIAVLRQLWVSSFISIVKESIGNWVPRKNQCSTSTRFRSNRQFRNYSRSSRETDSLQEDYEPRHVWFRTREKGIVFKNKTASRQPISYFGIRSESHLLVTFYHKPYI
jgi:hypothetical protein